MNVIDVVKSKVIKDQTVKLQGGKFTSISKTQAQDAQAGDWIVVDAKGLYMCPGLIDCELIRRLMGARADPKATCISTSEGT